MRRIFFYSVMDPLGERRQGPKARRDLRRINTGSWITLLVVASAVLAGASAALAENGFRLVANESIKVKVMKAGLVSDLFLRKKTIVAAGVTAELIDQKDDSSVRKAFSKVVHDRSVNNVKSYWRKKLFAGEDTQPLQGATDLEILEYVRAHPGGLGYISPDTEPVGVQAVAVLTPPKRVRMVDPNYTRAAREERFSGVVVLRLLVDVSGKVSVTKVLENQPHGLTEAAIEAAEKWKYRPSELDGEPTEAKIDVSLRFEYQ